MNPGINTRDFGARESIAISNVTILYSGNPREFSFISECKILCNPCKSIIKGEITFLADLMRKKEYLGYISWSLMRMIHCSAMNEMMPSNNPTTSSFMAYERFNFCKLD